MPDELIRRVVDDEAVMVNPDLANVAAQLVRLMREERDYLTGKGVDPPFWRRSSELAFILS